MASMKLNPLCSMAWTISSVSAFVLKDAPRATNDALDATAKPSVFSGVSRLPHGVDGAFWSVSDVGETWPLVRP